MDGAPAPVILDDLVGHRFAGGITRIEHWENFLLTEATGSEPLPEGLAHPIHLFHVPIRGVGTTIAELFALAEAEGPDRVGLASYDWEWFAPLREELDYRCEGEVVSVDRCERDGRAFDELVFRVELFEGGDDDAHLVARVTNTWHLWRHEAT